MRLREILFFWLPLLVSWMLMTSEGPVITALVSRRPDAVVQLAAVGIVIALSVAIESPVIQLLATATALVRDGGSYRVVRRFTVHWMIALTAVHLLVIWRPAFDLVVRSWMGAPEEVARGVLTGMQIMVPWSAAIAWRRFLQGVLIRGGWTRSVAWGTAVRLLASGGTAVFLALGSEQPGVAVGSWALVAGVVIEALFVSAAARRLVQWEASEGPAALPLASGALWRFHLPLAATSALALVVQPLVAATLSRLERPEVSLAAWPIVFHLTLWLRAPAFALPEAVVALSSRPGAARPLRRFSLYLAGGVLGWMVLMVATPLLERYLFGLQALELSVGEAARRGILMLVPFPALAILISWLRGRLIVEGRTGVVNLGMMLNVAVTSLLLGSALLLRGDGIAWAGAALSAAALAEVGLLFARGGESLS